jgi:CheY-like chemotaxis protein
MTMPRLSGDQAYVELRRIRADIPVVLSSGYNEQEATNRFAGKGLAGFLQKPYQPTALLKTLRNVLSA